MLGQSSLDTFVAQQVVDHAFDVEGLEQLGVGADDHAVGQTFYQFVVWTHLFSSDLDEVGNDQLTDWSADQHVQWRWQLLGQQISQLLVGDTAGFEDCGGCHQLFVIGQSFGCDRAYRHVNLQLVFD
ncbi:hypothetical protein D3C71_1847060 [compost metagenome]